MQVIQQSVQSGLLHPVRKIGLAATSFWPWPVRIKLRNQRRIYVDIRSRVGRRLFMKGEFDPEVFTPFRTALKPGGVFLDVGANAGFYSMLALDLIGPTGAVHAFDIDRRALRCLGKTIRREGIANLFLHAVGVSNADGYAFLEAIDDCGQSRIRSNGTGPRVPTVTLDSWRAKHPGGRIQGIKMDIEGGELAALQGAMTLLRTERPLVVCELLESHTRRMGYQAGDVIQLLESIGYKVRWLEGLWFPGIVAE